MTVTVTPATIVDLAELSGAITRQQWADARELMAVGVLYAFRAGEELIALGGFLPIGDTGVAQMVFNPAPAAARHMLGFLAAARLTIKAAPYVGILTVCGTAAGKIFVKRIGFVFQASTDFGEIWRYGAAVRKFGEEDPATAAGPDPAAGGPGGSGSADQPGADRR